MQPILGFWTLPFSCFIKKEKEKENKTPYHTTTVAVEHFSLA